MVAILRELLPDQVRTVSPASGAALPGAPDGEKPLGQHCSSGVVHGSDSALADLGGDGED